jgi:hypothetical protein
MSGWLERWRERQRDLARGVDADLVSDNHRRYKLAGGLIGLGFLLILVGLKARLSGALPMILATVGGALVIAGWFLGIWANRMNMLLRKPDAEDPPRIFKK